MKPQDILFFVVILFLVFLKRNVKITAGIGICCLLIAIPLFAKWIFFTAERLTWYAAAFFLLAIIFSVLEKKHDK